jgi:Fe-S-cluster containining protein
MPEPAEQRFACTQCGKCCNRAPEVELSEAAALADDFVFRLSFRLYQAPRALADYDAGGTEQFYQEKRLLGAFAARKSPVKLRRQGRPVEYVQYLAISALALDRGTGACSALADGRCAIYPRRPLGCRAVPFHHSRAEASLSAYLREFVATPGYACDTGGSAPVVLDAGKLADTAAMEVRAGALALAERERAWKDAIVRCLKAPGGGLPGLREIETNAQFGVTTTSMRLAWQIAADARLLGAEECRALVSRQLAVIDRELASGGSGEARETLLQMRAEYQART